MLTSLFAAISFSMPMLTTATTMQCDFKEFSFVFERSTTNRTNVAFTGEGPQIKQFASEVTFMLEDEGVYVLVSESGLIVAVNPSQSKAITNTEEAACFKIEGI